MDSNNNRNIKNIDCWYSSGRPPERQTDDEIIILCWLATPVMEFFNGVTINDCAKTKM